MEGHAYSKRPAAMEQTGSMSTKGLPTLPLHTRTQYHLRQGARRIVRGWWSWEVLAAVISVAATIALTIVLHQADKRQSQQWIIGNTRLTLNTIVAIIGTVQRAALLLAVTGALNQQMWNWFAAKLDTDEHPHRHLRDVEVLSEGASNLLNCIELIWRMRGRYLASAGASIIILSIAFDAFLQQLTVIENQPQRVKLSSNLTGANVLPQVLNLTDLSYTREHTHGSGFQSDLHFATDLKGLLSLSLYQKATSPPVAACPTGQCDWPRTPTLGICSRCTGLKTRSSTSLNASCAKIINYTVDTSQWLSIQAQDGSPSPLEYSSCGGTLSSSWKLYTLQPGLQGDNSFITSYIPGESIDEARSTISYLFSYGIPVNFTYLSNGTTDIEAYPFTAHACQFYFCVKSYSASLSQGAFAYDAPEELANRTSFGGRNNQNLTLLQFNGLENAHTKFNISPEAAFLYAPPFYYALNYQKFQTRASGIPDLFTVGDQDSFWVASSSLANLTAHTQNIAEDLTSWMRTKLATRGKPDQAYAPIITVQVPTVIVRWEWLAYPLALQFTGLLFLGLTMYVTSRRNVRPWKGHRMPLLLAKVDDSIQKRASGGLANRTGLDDRLANIRVRLDFDGEDGITFRRA